jgi:hypothetical protein
MLHANNLSWSNLFNNLEKCWLLLSTLFLLFFCKLKSENNKKNKLKTIRALHGLHARDNKIQASGRVPCAQLSRGRKSIGVSYMVFF